MESKTKVWVGLGLMTGVALSGVANAGGRLSEEGFSAKAPHQSAHSIEDDDDGPAAGSVEGEGVQVADPDIDYLVKIALIQGHMLVGYKLHEKGHAEMAKSHMKHPRDEVYKELEPLLEQRKANFAKELDALATAVVKGEPVAVTGKLQADFTAAVGRAYPKLSAATVGKAIHTLVKVSGDEYEIAVKDGRIVNLHEFQDAWGFVQVSQALLGQISAEDASKNEVRIKQIAKDLAGLDELWPDVASDAVVPGKVSKLRSAAARIDLTTRRIE